MATGEAAEDFEPAPGRLVRSGLEGLAAQVVQLDLVRERTSRGILHFAKFLDLGIRECRLQRPAPSHEVDLPDLALPQRLDGVVRHIGRLELGGSATEDPGDIDGDISGTDDHGRPASEVEVEARVVGVPVEPRHELGGRVTPGEVLPRNAEAPVGLGARAENDLVVHRSELGEGEVLPVLDIAEKPDVGPTGQLVVDVRDGLDLRVVGRNPVSHEAERGREGVVEIDRDPARSALEQVLNGVETRRTRADDRHSQRSVGRTRSIHRSLRARGRADLSCRVCR